MPLLFILFFSFQSMAQPDNSAVLHCYGKGSGIEDILITRLGESLLSKVTFQSGASTVYETKNSKGLLAEIKKGKAMSFIGSKADSQTSRGSLSKALLLSYLGSHSNKGAYAAVDGSVYTLLCK